MTEVEKDRHRVAENCSGQALREMPQVAGPRGLDREAAGELADERFDVRPHCGDDRRVFRPGVRGFFLERSCQKKAFPGEHFLAFRTPLVAVTQGLSAASGNQFTGHGKVGHVRWRDDNLRAGTLGAAAQMYAKAVVPVCSGGRVSSIAGGTAGAGGGDDVRIDFADEAGGASVYFGQRV